MAKDNIVQFPKQFTTAEEALEFSKGWNFETVVIMGHTAEGGTVEGGLVLGSNKANATETAKDMLHMAELLRWMAMKTLGFM